MTFRIGLFLALLIGGIVFSPIAAADHVTLQWEVHSTADRSWFGTTWSPDLEIFVSVGFGSSDNAITTSLDGETWKQFFVNKGSLTDISWSSELGIFVAVSQDESGEQVITSKDGEVWEIQTTPGTNRWWAVDWSPELGLFAAGSLGSSETVMTSPDGENWTARTTPGGISIQGMAWSPELGIFAGVSSSGHDGDYVVTSSDGINWIIRDSPAGSWWDIVWAPELGIFVGGATGGTGGGNIMTSTDGITWSLETTPGQSVRALAYSPEMEMLLAVGPSNGAEIMTSNDGKEWVSDALPETGTWQGAAWSPQLLTFLAMKSTTGNKAATGIDPDFNPLTITITDSPSSVTAGQSFEIKARVDNLTTEGVPGRSVGLVSVPTEVAQIEITDENGIATFTLSLSLTQTYTLTAVEQEGDTDSVQITVVNPAVPPGTEDTAAGSGSSFVEVSKKTGFSVGGLQFFIWIVLFMLVSMMLFGVTRDPLMTAALGVPVSVLLGVVMGLLQLWIMQVMVFLAGAIWVYVGGRGGGDGINAPVKIIITWMVYFVFLGLLISQDASRLPEIPVLEATGRRGLFSFAADVIVGLINVIWVGVAFLYNIMTFNIQDTPTFIRLLLTGVTNPPLFWAIARMIRGN